ncbi:hypothetical protein AVEN_124631-1 [Araneus ventricosus]|uniref:Sushi domain-containing protein n=1 Tax=Araneus ventricosus TaxID=182803 RepID=A0A4Y2N593_ARAVE|nr:hypothetical protein AVEN_124631-1 [Araneus ventricosus]
MNMQWEPLPICETPVPICPPPGLPPNILGLLEDCNAKRVGETCRLRCLQGGNMFGSDSIVCSADLSWSPLPLCTCPLPVLPRYNQFKEDCTMKKPREYCQISCGPQLHSLVCHENGKWSQFPPCGSAVEDNVDTVHLYYG